MFRAHLDLFIDIWGQFLPVIAAVVGLWTRSGIFVKKTFNKLLEGIHHILPTMCFSWLGDGVHLFKSDYFFGLFSPCLILLNIIETFGQH